MQAVARSFLRVPVFGWFLRDAIYGLPDAKYWFVGNLVFAFGFLTYMLGYPFLIVFALSATATMWVLLVILTASDMIANAGKRKARR